MKSQGSRSGGKILVDQLKIHGANLAFCVPGESYLPVLDALYEHRDSIRLITCRHESGAANMAEAYGKLTGTKAITANAPVGSITDSAIQKQIKAWIRGGIIPKPNKNTLYFIYLEPGIVSIMGGSKSCQSYCGYHNHIAKTYYAVMPYPSCGGCLGGLSVTDALTGTSSHELCEAITDPIPGQGWYDNVNGEIGDICAWSFKMVAGYKVQLEWSNVQNKCV